MRPLIIGGPTAAGKSSVALDIARRFGAQIISADAMTVYRHMDVATAKPSHALLEEVPHHCINVRDPDEDFTVEDFAQTVQRVMATTTAPVVIAGGTPFYLAALVKPLPELPTSVPEVRAEMEALADPHARLMQLDPICAQRLHPNDRVRVIRALEVIALSGEKMSVLQAAPPRRPALDATVVWLDHTDLRERIGLRLKEMVGDGYLEETRSLLQAGWGPDLKPMKSFAYRHFIMHIQGEISFEEAIRCTERDTWRLARKQRNWGRSMGWEMNPDIDIHHLAAQAFSQTDE